MKTSPNLSASRPTNPISTGDTPNFTSKTLADSVRLVGNLLAEQYSKQEISSSCGVIKTNLEDLIDQLRKFSKNFVADGFSFEVDIMYLTYISTGLDSNEQYNVLSDQITNLKSYVVFEKFKLIV